MDIPEDLIEPEFILYAVALGELCNSWAKLEIGVRMLFFNASGLKPDRMGFGIVHCFGVRELLTAVRLCIIDNADGTIKAAALGHLNYIDNELRPRRNRHVHDPWHYSDQTGTVDRIDYTPRISKQPLRWETAEWSSSEDPAELWELVREVRRCDALLYTMQDALKAKPDAVASLLQAPPLQRYPLPQ